MVVGQSNSVEWESNCGRIAVEPRSNRSCNQCSLCFGVCGYRNSWYSGETNPLHGGVHAWRRCVRPGPAADGIRRRTHTRVGADWPRWRSWACGGRAGDLGPVPAADRRRCRAPTGHGKRRSAAGWRPMTTNGRTTSSYSVCSRIIHSFNSHSDAISA